MKRITLSQYAPIISNDAIGAEIYSLLKSELQDNEIIEVDLGPIIAMVTLCAKQIFGRLYSELGANIFVHRVKLVNANKDVKSVIMEGISSALNSK